MGDAFDFVFSSEVAKKYDVVGPICESSDRFGKDVSLAETLRGDLLKIYSCGAYAESMSMNYNMRGEIGKVYLEGKMDSPYAWINAVSLLSS